MSTDRTRPEAEAARPRTAGALDIRNIIGALLAIYGVLLLLVHVFGDDTATTGPTHDQANLWTGAALLLSGLLFFVWTWMRPTVIEPEHAEDRDEKREFGTPGSTTD